MAKTKFLLKISLLFFAINLQANEVGMTRYYDLISKMKEVHSRINVGGVVSKVDASLFKVFDEQTTDSYNNEKRASASGIAPLLFSTSLVLVPYSTTYTKTKSWSHSRIVARNPEKISGFDLQIEKNTIDLQNNLKRYISENITPISNIKILAASAFIEASRLIDQGYSFKISDIENILNMALLIDFSGIQTISICTQTNYANIVTEEKEELSGFFGIFIDGNTNVKNTHKKLAHSIKDCDYPYSLETSVSALEVSLDLGHVDKVLKNRARSLFLKILFEQKGNIFFPDFGNLYYN